MLRLGLGSLIRASGRSSLAGSGSGDGGRQFVVTGLGLGSRRLGWPIN